MAFAKINYIVSIYKLYSLNAESGTSCCLEYHGYILEYKVNSIFIAWIIFFAVVPRGVY